MTKYILSIFAFLAFAICASSAALAGNLKLTNENIHFSFNGTDGMAFLKCDHAIENADSQDWKVICKDEAGKNSREFLAHVWVTSYPHKSGPPKTSFEILYWITDRSNPKTQTNNGTTVWFHLKDPSDLYQLDISQLMDDGTGELNLSFLPK